MSSTSRQVSPSSRNALNGKHSQTSFCPPVNQREYSSQPNSTTLADVDMVGPQKLAFLQPRLPSLKHPQPVATILVGPTESLENFVVHKNLICHYSPFFAAAFNGSFVEGTTQTMTLPDVDLDTFSLLVQWLYTQTLDLDPLSGENNITPLSHLWTLASRFLIPTLQNSIMDVLHPLVQASEGSNLKSFLHYAYESKHDVLKRLAADRMAWTTTAQALGVWIKEGHLPEGMLVDVVLSLKREHVHGKTKGCRGFGAAREYYVEVGGKVGGDVEEK